MKNLWICFLLLISLSACSSSSSDQGSCNKNAEVCIKIRAEEPIVYKEPINIVITITSEKDYSMLGISLITWPGIVIGDTPKVEQGTELWKGQSGVDWMVDIKAGEIVTLTRKIYLPPGEGVFSIAVHASTPEFRVIDSLNIYQTKDDVKVYLSGTKVPITPGPLPTTDPILLKTLQAMPTETPFPKHTPAPPVYLEATSTTRAYPPPGSPSPGAPYP
jgi:hypothetical protein